MILKVVFRLKPTNNCEKLFFVRIVNGLITNLLLIHPLPKMSVNTQTSYADYNFSNLDELIVATDPQNGNYVIQLYGNIFIHQKPGQAGAITAYQTDTKGKLHIIDNIVSNCAVSQLSVSADGRFFGFLTNDGDLTSAYVYFLNTQDNSMDITYSWSYKNCLAPTLFFSANGHFAVFSPCAEKIHIQPLYTPNPEVVFEAPAELTQPSDSNYLVCAQGIDYLVWLQPHGHLKVIDLVAGQKPTEWLLSTDDTALLPTKDSNCMFYNNYVIHIHNPSEKAAHDRAKITILAISSISQTVRTVSKFSFPEIGGYTWCKVNSDGQSITLHNRDKNHETRMSVLLPEIITSFSD